MAHEKSETVEIDGRWFNRDTVGKDKGRILGRRDGYPTEAAAVTAAKKRSRSFDAGPRKSKRGTRAVRAARILTE